MLLWLVAVARSPLLVKGLESILSVSGLSKKKKESQLVLIVVNPKHAPGCYKSFNPYSKTDTGLPYFTMTPLIDSSYPPLALIPLTQYSSNSFFNGIIAFDSIQGR